jgi:ribulose-5-phosphate 4-epimerase/fuculose-1-phosphate aldolase
VSAQGPPADLIAEFASAGRILFSLGLVKDAEGNLSVFDGRTLWITRTGASLAQLEGADILAGGMTGDLPDASTDIEVHRNAYWDRGPGALAHAHSPGTVPEGGGGPGEHGVYVFGRTLREAVEDAVRSVRETAEGLLR